MVIVFILAYKHKFAALKFMQNKKIFVGLRREDKSYWERRTPLPPDICREIMQEVFSLSFYFTLKNSIPTYKLLSNHLQKEFSQTAFMNKPVASFKKIYTSVL